MKEMKILGIGSEEYEIMDGKARPVQNIAEMKTIDNLIAGNIVRTIGYYEANDGGGALYLIREKTETDVEDRALIHFINDTLVAELLYMNKVNIKQFGAKSDKSEDISGILNNIVTNTSVTEVFFEKGDYLLTSTVNLTRKILLDFNDSNVEFTGAGYCFNISTKYTGKAVIKNVNLTGTFENGFIMATMGVTAWGTSFNLYGSRILKFANLINGENVFNSIVEDTIFQSHGIFTYNAHEMSNANRFVNCYFLNYDGNTVDTYPDYKFVLTNVKNMLFVGCSFEQYKTLINNTNCAKINFINCESEQQTGAIAKNSSGIIYDNQFMIFGMSKIFETDNVKYEALSKLEGGQYTVEETNANKLRYNILQKKPLKGISKYVSNGSGSVQLYRISDDAWNIQVPINTLQKTITNGNELTQSMEIPCEWQANESTLFTIYIIITGQDGSRQLFESKFIEINSERFLDLGLNKVNEAVWEGCDLDGLEVTELLDMSNYKVTLNKTVKQCTAVLKYEKLGINIW